jgi:hypothetical protein
MIENHRENERKGSAVPFFVIRMIKKRCRKILGKQGHKEPQSMIEGHRENERQGSAVPFFHSVVDLKTLSQKH